MASNTTYDIIIIGGGMVGASLAAALMHHADKKIAIVEARAFNSSMQPSFDDRSVALSYGSRRILEAMDLWDIVEDKLEAIKTIHISDRGYLGASRIMHDEENVEALGYVIENRVLGGVLMEQLKNASHIDWFCPATIESLTQTEADVSVELKTEKGIKSLSAKLLVAADGVQSKTRELTGLDVTQQDYQQSAVITNVQTDQRHNGIAYERFTESGPIAFLPMTENRYSVVWTCNRQDVESKMQSSDDEFKQALQARFGFRAGNIIKAGKRASYPLCYTESEQITKGRVVIIGNAAHTLHPVAGQGYNLALRDVAELAELIVSTDDPGYGMLLAKYHAARLKDMQRIYHATDSLVKIFSNKFRPLGHVRALGLISVDLMPALRSWMARQSMGLSGRMTKLQRRISL